MVNIRNLEAGNAIRIVKKFRDCTGTEFEAGRILHFVRRDFLPYHSGHTVYFREATVYLCDDDATSAVVQNEGGEYYALTEAAD
jgi:hypothetical protein